MVNVASCCVVLYRYIAMHRQQNIKFVRALHYYYYYYYYYYTIQMSIVKGLFFPVLLLNHR